ncbi:MAG TPA: thioesterase family protein [Gemmatimonadales bacterium]|jgi:acyl-CoA thioester hydrolase|nr:thioesterase family protein [Gemmatimonadales bacterium]
MTETIVRVNYSEIDQMGVVYHARYLVWLDVARCEYLRRQGMSYAELEQRGLRLAVSELRIRYRQPARYDEVIRVRCWVREAATRRVSFGYALDLPDHTVVATAEVSLLALGADFSLSRLPPDVLALLRAEPDPLRLF